MIATMELLSNPLAQPIALVLAMGLVAYLLAGRIPAIGRLLALAAGVGTFVCGLYIAHNPQRSFHWQWVRLTESISIDVDLVTSNLGMLVVVAAAAFTVLITIYSSKHMAGSRDEGKYYAYIIWTLGGACIVALAGNLVVLLVGWEIVTLMLFLLVNQGRGDARAGAAKAYGVLGFSDACLLLAIALLAASGGSAKLAFPDKPFEIGAMGPTGYAVYVLILVAALAKAGAIPLHTWIPSIASDTPAPVMAYLPAALDKLLGIYLLAVLSLRMFHPDWALQVVMMVVGAVTILGAVLMAMMQHNLKKLLSFHAVSQVGYMVLGLGTGTAIGVLGGLFHMLNHSIYKCNLFLMSGTVGRASGTDEIEDMGGLARALPITFICGVISALAISGVPPLNGFASKWLVYQGTLQVSGTNQGLAITLVVMAVFGSALTLASFVKVIYAGFLSPAPRGTEKHRSGAKENLLLVAPMIVLAILCVLMGLFPARVAEHVLAPGVPGAVGEQITTELSFGRSTIVTPLGRWQPTHATGLILIGIVLGLIFAWLATLGKRVRVVRPFLAGEVPAPDDDRFRVPGTHLYKTIGEVPIIGPLLHHGEGGAMDPYHWSAKHGNTFVQMLRRLHTGLVSLYVTWCLLGLTVILLYLFITAGSS